MTNASFHSSAILPGELQALAQALLVAGLPGDDVLLSGRVFYAFHFEGQHIGYAGLEAYGPAALLRSVLIDEQHRRRGLGTLVVHEVERLARDRGIESLHLLTTNQAPFFERIGYVMTPRQLAPTEIASTTQFKSLCPSSASYLQKTLRVLPLDSQH